MAKGPAPKKDSNAVTAGSPNTTSMLTILFELNWFKVLVRFIFSSISVTDSKEFGLLEVSLKLK